MKRDGSPYYDSTAFLRMLSEALTQRAPARVRLSRVEDLVQPLILARKHLDLETDRSKHHVAAGYAKSILSACAYFIEDDNFSESVIRWLDENLGWILARTQLDPEVFRSKGATFHVAPLLLPIFSEPIEFLKQEFGVLGPTRLADARIVLDDQIATAVANCTRRFESYLQRKSKSGTLQDATFELCDFPIARSESGRYLLRLVDMRDWGRSLLESNITEKEILEVLRSINQTFFLCDSTRRWKGAKTGLPDLPRGAFCISPKTRPIALTAKLHFKSRHECHEMALYVLTQTCQLIPGKAPELKFESSRVFKREPGLVSKAARLVKSGLSSLATNKSIVFRNTSRASDHEGRCPIYTFDLPIPVLEIEHC